MRALTERQERLLVLYLDHGTLTHAEAAQMMGLSAPRRSRGPWSGPMNPAQRLIGTVRGLEARELVGMGRRRDGLSGTAYRLTEEGERVAEELRARGVRP